MALVKWPQAAGFTGFFRFGKQTAAKRRRGDFAAENSLSVPFFGGGTKNFLPNKYKISLDILYASCYKLENFLKGEWNILMPFASIIAILIIVLGLLLVVRVDSVDWRTAVNRGCI
ncbi:MAG: hypothetical protein ACOX88_07785 [Christensenellales bacterium]|jgi:hypothetical protein